MMEQDNAMLGQQGDVPESNLPQEGTNSNNNMEALLQEEGLALDFPQPGEIRTGTIASISPSQILVSVGAKSEGVITGRELESIPTEQREALQVGQEVLVYVLAAEDANGTVVLSYTRAQEQKGWLWTSPSRARSAPAPLPVSARRRSWSAWALNRKA